MSNILEQYNDYYKHKHEYQEKIDKKVLDKKRKNDNWPYPKDEEYKPNFKLTGDIKNEVKKIRSNPEIIFSDKGRKLTAVCGANSDCGYEKEIPLPEIYQFDKIKNKLKKEIEKLKSEIIRWKLNLLYNLDSEEVVLREFNEIKEKLSFKQRKLNKIISIQKKKFTFTVDNQEQQVDMTVDEIVEKIDKNIQETIFKYKNNLNDFIKDTTDTSKLKVIMEHHKKIRDGIEEKRKIQYKLGNIEIEHDEHKNTWTLIKDKLSYNNLEIKDD